MRRTTVIIYKYFINCTSNDDIKARYRKLAMTHHPDKGGKEEVFKEVVAEYSYLKQHPPATFPVSNIQPGYSSAASMPKGEYQDFWKHTTRAGDHFRQASDIFEQFERMRKQQEEQRRDPEGSYWENEEKIDALLIFLKELVRSSIVENRTANWLLMEIYKIEGLGINHFKYVRFRLFKEGNEKYKLPDSWIGTSYRNYIAIQTMDWG